MCFAHVEELPVFFLEGNIGKGDAVKNEALERLREWTQERSISLDYLRKVTFRTYCEGYLLHCYCLLFLYTILSSFPASF